MFKFLNSTSPVNYLLAPLFLLVHLIIMSFANSLEINESSSGIAESLITLLNTNAVVTIAAQLILTTIAAVILNIILINYKVFNKLNYIVITVYILLNSMLYVQFGVIEITILNVFIILLLALLMDLARSESTQSVLFNAGLLVGLGTIILPKFAIMWLLIPTALSLHRTFKIREWAIPFIGTIVPFLFLLTYYFCNDQLTEYIDTFLNDFNPISPELSLITGTNLIVGIILLLLVVMGSISYFKEMITNTARQGKNFVLFIWFFVFGLVCALLNGQNVLHVFSWVSIPLTIYLSTYLINIRKNFFREFLLGLLIVLTFIKYF